MSEQEEIRKLRVEIADLFFEAAIKVENGEPIDSLAFASSLLRNLPIPLYIDTGELTDKETNKAFVEGYHSFSRYPSGLPKLFCGYRAVAEATRAKFKSIGSLMEDGNAKSSQ